MENASNEYLRNAVLTASPEQLHLMLYDGAIRFTKQGIEGIQGRNWEQAFNGLARAQKIILEMSNSLNHDVDPPLCARMAALYNFIYRKLVDASVQRSADLAREALGLIEYQRETWVLLLDKLRRERGSTKIAPENDAMPPAVPPSEGQADSAAYGTLSVEG